jgi:hypothetical protein
MPARKKEQPLDLSKFPPGTVTEYTTLVCLACVFDIFTTQLGLAPRTAYSEVKKYAPSVDELTAPRAVRPFFDSEDQNPHCPYCNAAKRWQARLDTYGIEGAKSADAARRELIRTLPKKDEQFRVQETKSDRRQVFFAWLDTLGRRLDLEEDSWLIPAARAYLERLEPKTGWAEIFEGVRAIRRSNRIEEGWELDGARLFLAPQIYNEVLVVQYLLSRSHAHGGLTLDGRLTLMELIRRLRYSGYLKSQELEEGDQFEVLESVIDKLAGGTGPVKVYYLVDRRNFLEKVKSVYARYAG